MLLTAAEARMRVNRKNFYSEDEIPEIKDPAVKKELDKILGIIENSIVQGFNNECILSSNFLPGTTAFLYLLGYSLEYTVEETTQNEKQLVVYVRW